MNRRGAGDPATGWDGLGALLLDFDGLLLDTETCTWAAVREAFEEHGETLDISWWHSIIGTADHPHWSDVLAERVGTDIDLDEVRARCLARRRELLELETLRPGVTGLLDAADAAGVPTAVVSSSSLAWVDGHLRRLGVAHRFHHLTTRDDVGGDPRRTKPAPDLFLRAAERLGVEPAACVVLEDSPHGVAGARAAGMAVVAVPGQMTAGLDFSGADAVVGSLTEVELPALARLVRRAGRA
ncbi:MAG TPA: HAD-IA family hydrolase [Acidimicrobiales bacterium]